MDNHTTSDHSPRRFRRLAARIAGIPFVPQPNPSVQTWRTHKGGIVRVHVGCDINGIPEQRARALRSVHTNLR